MSVRDVNLANLGIVAEGLAELVDDVAFVGGATIALYVDDPGAADIRVTKDVDCVIDIADYGAFARLETRLRELGFVNVKESDAPICRWRYHGVVVDIMPTDPVILGFANRWYAEAMRYRYKVEVAAGHCIFVLPLKYLLATKLEAFESRGQGDFLASHDLEDVVALLDGATNVADELHASQGPLRDYLGTELGRLVKHPNVDEIIVAHLASDATTERRAQRVKRLLETFLLAFAVKGRT
jgi:hypothetical protein